MLRLIKICITSFALGCILMLSLIVSARAMTNPYEQPNEALKNLQESRESLSLFLCMAYKTDASLFKNVDFDPKKCSTLWKQVQEWENEKKGLNRT